MSYRVVWRRDVADRLETATFVAFERGRDTAPITRAIGEVDRRLQAEPAAAGESREGAERVVIVAPLAVTYEVFDSEQVVLIYAAVLYPRLRL